MFEDTDYSDSDDTQPRAPGQAGADFGAFDDPSFGNADFGGEPGEGISYEDDATYACAFCGETNSIDVDFTAGDSQSYTEDCQVCCRPNALSIEFSDDGRVEVWAEPEA